MLPPLRPALRATLAAAAFAFVAALATLPAWATIVLRANVAEMTDACHRAVLGRVTSRAVTLDRAAGRIWTTYEVAVDETWVGDAGGEVVVSVPGGEAEGVTQDFAGGATLEVGGRAALFLWKGEGDRWLVLGEAQGAFAVERDAATGEDRCRNRLEGLALVDAAGRRVEADPIRLPLRDLRAQVAAARKAREDRERAEREERARRLDERRKRAERRAEETRGKPGGPPAAE